jgi:hypothetical protein
MALISGAHAGKNVISDTADSLTRTNVLKRSLNLPMHFSFNSQAVFMYRFAVALARPATC